MVALAFLFRPLDNSAGRELLSAEIVEDQFAAPAERPGGPEHRSKPRDRHFPGP